MFDLIIIGSGPAGLAASIYASRYKIGHLVIGKKKGGTIGLSHQVENYPGFRSIPGLELMEKIEKHARGLGGEIIYDPAEDIKGHFGSFFVFTDQEKEYKTKSIIIATGTERRKLDIPGEKELLGHGVSYCTVCDAAFFRGKTVAMIGGANSACCGAAHLAEYAQKVYVIYRRDKLRAEPSWVDQIERNPQIIPIYNTNVVKIKGDQVVTGVVLDRPYQGKKELALDGVFIEIGGIPGSNLAKLAGVEVDDQDYIKVDDHMRTNVNGIFAAGDATDFWPKFKQMISASAMGARAAASVYEYLKQEDAPQQKG